MSLLTPPMSSPASLKRSFADTGLDEHSQHQITPSPTAAVRVPVSNQASSQSPSPTNLPMCTSSAASNTAAAAVTDVTDPSTATAENSNQRKKLTFAEKEATRIENQFKEQQKVEEKATKEEEQAKKKKEKVRRDEEKRVKDAEKEERKKVREEQAKVREAEKQKKLEEKNKKARVCHCESRKAVSKTLTFPIVTTTSQRFLRPAFHAAQYTKCITNLRHSKPIE